MGLFPINTFGNGNLWLKCNGFPCNEFIKSDIIKSFNTTDKINISIMSLFEFKSKEDYDSFTMMKF